MVNYHDPAVFLQDFCAYAFVATYMGSGSQLTSFDRGCVEILACCGWTLLVCLAHQALDSPNNNNSAFITSWEFVTTLDYEWSVIRRHRPYRWTIWVRINALFLSGLSTGLVYHVWQIYSTTRISVLVAVPLTLVGLNVTARYNCEVHMSICFICGCDLINHDPKVETVFQLVSKPLRCT
jgi:hypothetical protein